MTDLVIFDCDGVLVDSESIASAALARMGMLQGAQIEHDEALMLFRGSKMAKCIGEIERRAGKRMPDSFEADVRVAMAAAFATELKAIEGIHDALAQIAIPVCVASNGPMFKMMQTLELTGLMEHFRGRIFSAYDVGAWKPDPGLFLHAAQALGAEPSRCVVVEDSLPGIRAAKAAGIPVLGFTGGDPESALHGECEMLFHSMSELPDLLQQRAA
jgi:HAD superfamily hydrolase (TIGR01509 family)